MSPCYQCGSRTVGCHGTCAEYGEYRRKEDERKKLYAYEPIRLYLCQKGKERKISSLKRERKRASCK